MAVMKETSRAVLFDWSSCEVLIIGGTGSLGKTITKLLKSKYKPRGIRIYSRDEFKQWEFKNELKALGLDDKVSFLIGDVRDKERLYRAMARVDLVINAAAMKQVPACEYNPIEAVKTNITGAHNIIECALDNNVRNVMHVSTDKAVYPVNLYGATKAVAEKLFIHSNVYSGGSYGTRFSCCRYGNVLGSRGSILPLFQQQAKQGEITITDKRMTRFWITLTQVAEFIITRCAFMEGGELFIPNMPSMNISALASALWPDAAQCEVGVRQGEKLHECLITEEESLFTDITSTHYCITQTQETNKPPFTLTSENNPWLLSPNDLRALVRAEKLLEVITAYENPTKSKEIG
jgi:UDP-N-acetylglucosamine 4,6-dehydratase/5-epimerase